MAVDVSRIPNNNKFDPVREAILQLQSDVQSGVSGVGSINGQDGLITITGGDNIGVSTAGTTITVGLDSSIDLTNITLSGYLRGPSTFTIDPAAHGDDTGTVVIAGNLQVDGTTTTINSTTLTVDDKNIVLASGAANAAAANGAGITIDGASATITYDSTYDEWDFNKSINVSGDLTLGDANPQIYFNDSSITNLTHSIYSGSNKLVIATDVNQVHTNSRIEFLVDTVERMQITDTNVDIVGDLDVTGDATATTFIGDLEGNADTADYATNADQVDGRHAEQFTLDYVTGNPSGAVTDNKITLGSGSAWTSLVLNADPNSGNANAGVAIAFDGTDHSEYGYRFKANGTNYYQVLYDGSDINWKHYESSAYTTKMSLSNDGDLTLTGNLDLSGSVDVGGSTVITSGRSLDVISATVKGSLNLTTPGAELQVGGVEVIDASRNITAASLATDSITGGTININASTRLNLQYAGSTKAYVDSDGFTIVDAELDLSSVAGIILTDGSSSTDSYFHANVDYDGGLYTVTSNARYGSDYIQVDGEDSREDRRFVISPKDIGSPDPDATLYLGGDYSITAPNTLDDWYAIEMNALSVQINNNEVATQTWVTNNTLNQTAGDNRYLQLTGGTLTGNLSINTGTNGSSTNPYYQYDRIIFNNQFSDVARGANKIVFYDDAWLGGIGVHDDTVAYYSGGEHIWYESDGTNFNQKMRLTDGGSLITQGRIGISGQTPKNNLHIGNNVSSGGFSNYTDYQILLYDNATPTTSYGIGIEGGTLMFNSDNRYRFYSDNTLVMTITDGGSVEASGNASFNSGVLNLGSDSVASYVNAIGDVLILDVDSNANTGGTPNIQFKVGGSTKAFLNSTGLGIGATSPAQKLHINGNLLFENNKEIRFIDTSATQRTVTRVTSSNELEFGWSGAGAVKFMGGGSYTERMRIHTNGNVGIGTTSPSAPLHTYKNSTDAYNIFESSTNKWVFGEAGGVCQIAGLYGVHSGINVNTSGSVGIGTTSPNFKLQVNGDFAAEDNIYLTDAGTVRGKFELNSSDRDDVDIKAVSLGSNMKFFTVDTERMRIDSSGNVGVGVASPQAKIDVGRLSGGTALLLRNGDISTGTGNDVQVKLSFDNSDDYAHFIRTRHNSSDANNAIDFYTCDGTQNNSLTSGVRHNLSLNSGRVGIGVSDPDLNSLLDVKGNVLVGGGSPYSGTGVTSLTINNDSYPLLSLGSSTASRMEIISYGSYNLFNSTNNFVFDSGKVAINTTSSPLQLNVRGGLIFLNSATSSSASSLYFSPSNENTLNSGYGSNNDDYDMWINYRGYNDGFTRYRDLRIGDGRGTAFAFFKGSNQRMSLINTNPQTTLHIGAGTAPAYLSGVTLTLGSNQYYSASDGTKTVFMGVDSSDYGIVGMLTNHPLGFRTNNSERMRITSAGNVGINTTTPSFKLQLNAAGYGFRHEGDTNNTLTTYAGSSYQLLEAGNSGTINQFGYGLGAFYVQTNSTDRIKIDTSGNIGLGVGTGATTPLLTNSGRGNLTVNGSADAIVTLGINGTWYGYYYTTSSDLYLAHNGGNIQLQAGGSTKMYIASGGNIGIGTTSPATKLDVRQNDANTLISRVWNSGTGHAAMRIASSANVSNSARLEFSDSAQYNVTFSGDRSEGVLLRVGGASDPLQVPIRLQITPNGNAYFKHLVRLEGTTSSDSQLDLPPTWGALRWYDGSTFKGGIGTASWSGLGSGNDLGFYLNTANFHIGNGSTPFVTFDRANQRVGIGTTSPSAKFQVQHNGDNGSGGDSQYAILANASSGQATIGAIHTAGGYANLNLGSTGSGSGHEMWHISYRQATQKKLEYYWYSGGSFTSRFEFETNGDFKAGGDVIAYKSSDERLKDNIKPIENAIEKVKAIGGYEFDWNDNQESYEGHDVGVIAQEIEEVLPEIVTTRDTGYKAVQYEKLVPLLIEAIKEQQKQIDELKARLDA